MKRIFDKINNTPPKILTFCTHERYQSNMSDINAEFYILDFQNSKPWEKRFAKLPENHFFLPYNSIPQYFDYSFILFQSKYSQFELAQKIAKDFNIPLVCLEHTLPTSNFNKAQIDQLKRMVGNYNIFISEFNKKAWGSDGVVINHCVSDEFEYKEDHTNNTILSVQNQYASRNYCLNYDFYRVVTNGLPVKLVGDNPGLSEPAKDLKELISIYQDCSIYFNTAHESPLPSSLIEAMACGAVPVSVKTCAIPEYIEHEENGFLVSSVEEAKYYLKLLLDNEKLRKKLGKAASETIKSKCSKQRFTKDWNNFIQGIT